MTQPLRIGIAGLGLIGGSLALSLARRRPQWRRLGFDVQPAAVTGALHTGALDGACTTLQALVRECDLVVLCQPVDALLHDLAALAPLTRLPVLCDVASVKGAVLDAAAGLGPRRGRFVGAHPIAGKAESGWEAAEAGLFEGRRVVLCEQGADADACILVRTLWDAVGAHLHAMDALEHDARYAAVSHAPQLLTWAYLQGLDDLPAADQARALAGPGFDSFTRLGHSSPALWTGIALHNRAPLLQALDAIASRLDGLRHALQRADRASLQTLFDNARATLARASHPGGQDR